MSTVTLIWVASLGGALLFFSSGFLLSRRFALSLGPEGGSVASQRAERQIAAAEEQVRQAEAREEDTAAQLKNSQEELEQVLGRKRKTLSQFGEEGDGKDRVDQLKVALDQALVQHKEAEEKAERNEGLLVQSTGRTQELEDRCAALEDELEKTHSGRGSSSRLTQPQWRQGSGNEELAGMLEGSQQEVETLTAAMKNLRQQYEDSERRNDEVRLLLHRKEREIKEAQGVNKKLVRLRKEVEEAEQARRVLLKRLEDAPGGTHYLHQDTEVAALQQQLEQQQRQIEILRMENSSLCDLAADIKETGPPKRRRADTRPMKAVGGDIQQHMNRYMEAEAALGLVLADNNGLPVMSSGAHIDEIAAVAAHVTKLSSATAKLLPMKPLSRLTLEDVENRTVTILPVAEEELLLALLSDGAPPDEARLAEVLVQSEAMI